MTSAPHRGAEDAITPRLARTRRRYADAYRNALPAAARQFASLHAAGRALAVQRQAIIGQIAHATAATVLLKSARPLRPNEGGPMMNAQTSEALDRAGAALRDIGEEIVLLAFYRADGDRAGDRYSVRLALDGCAGGVQESAETPSAAFARAVAARASRRATLEAEAALRAEIAARQT